MTSTSHAEASMDQDSFMDGVDIVLLSSRINAICDDSFAETWLGKRSCASPRCIDIRGGKVQFRTTGISSRLARMGV